MTAWPKDTQTARNSFYGDPGKGQIAGQMVPVVPPFAMYYEGKRVKAIQFHKKAAPALLAALNEIWDYCQHDQAKVEAAGVSKYAGAYNPGWCVARRRSGPITPMPRRSISIPKRMPSE